MPELTENQITDLRALQDHCRSLAADLVIIGAIAYQVHFPREDRHTGDIDFAVGLDLDEFAELERRLPADRWIHFANRHTDEEALAGRFWICCLPVPSFERLRKSRGRRVSSP